MMGSPPAVRLPRAGFRVEEMRAVDEAMRAAGVGLLQMAESAGQALARAVAELVEERSAPPLVVVLAGPGGNGAGGLAAARQLLGRGFEVRAALARASARPEMRSLADQLAALGTPVADELPSLAGAGVVLDAMLGYGARGPPRESLASWVRAVRAAGLPVVANDVPTGLDPETGEAHEPVLPAAVTVTLCYPKLGLRAPGAARVVGRLRLAHIGVPASVYARFGVDPALLFARDTLVDVAP